MIIDMVIIPGMRLWVEHCWYCLVIMEQEVWLKGFVCLIGRGGAQLTSHSVKKVN